MTIKTEMENETTVLTFKGRLDASNSDELKKKFKQVHQQGNIFIFDLSNLDFIDSTGLGMIISCLKIVMEAKKKLKLSGMNNKVRMVFEITRAHKIFEIYDSKEAAMACRYKNS